MAWTVVKFQEQVQIMTDHKGLASKTITWINRTLMEILVKDYWQKQVNTVATGGASQVTTVTGQWFTDSAVSSLNIVDIHRIDYSTTAALVRQPVQDFYANFHGLNASNSTGDYARYCVPKWVSMTAGTYNDWYLIPEIGVSPIAATGTTDLTMGYLSAPDAFTATSDSNWITDQYPQVVLAGVLRRAFLFIGDSQRYLIWKAKFENGVRDMILSEQTSVAATPHLRGVYPEEILRGGQG